MDQTMPVFVTASAYGRDRVLQKGQAYFAHVVSEGGGNGIEIRRELFPPGLLPLDHIRQEVEKYSLRSVYSAPVHLWNDDNTLNEMELSAVMVEAGILGAEIVKFSLGHFNAKSDMDLFGQWFQTLTELERNTLITVENDQTRMGGRMQPLLKFFEECSLRQIPVRMTFDIGNWHWTGEQVLDAAIRLQPYVDYIHCKQVRVFDRVGEESSERTLETVPFSADNDHSWREVMGLFSPKISRAIEFPIEGDDLADATRYYTNLIRLG